MIDKLPNLKMIACRSTGFNHVDVAAAKEKGIVVANVPSYGGTTVAEYAFTLLLMLTRNMPAVLLETKSVNPNRQRLRGMDLSGRTIGVLGTGSIGLGAAKIAKGFNMEVLGFDKFPNSQAAEDIGFTYEENLDELVAKSDIITIHIPYSDETHHFLNEELLGKIKQGAIVINTARGELVDTTALVAALKNGRVSGAALDVVESEYLLDPDEIINLATHDDAAKETLRHAVSLAALSNLPNVIVTNHNAYNSKDALVKINQLTLENIINFINGKEVSAV